jgi:hypothetical protein
MTRRQRQAFRRLETRCVCGDELRLHFVNAAHAGCLECQDCTGFSERQAVA